MRSSSSIVAILLILTGIYLLLERRGLIPDFGPLLRAWWPALLIVLGVAMLARRSRRGG